MEHICSTCERTFDIEDDYLGHDCITGFKPTDVGHLDFTSGGQFSKQAEKAIQRGEDRRNNQDLP